MYYIDPFNYQMSSLLSFTTWSKPVTCAPDEVALFDPPANQTCGEYLATYQQGMGVGTNLLNPSANVHCRTCQYTTGGDYLKSLNLAEEHFGWRNAGLVVFVLGIYRLVFLMMNLRTKATKKAEN
ncbi:hypothetical protein PENNAL_c0004G11504 [Penicillium nalgiovense]|uniref:CDR ABC transporter domain-containing protein n=1 Tax=Penicillium nalgiovense TaxID=60175 RepID=A0A1V6Z3M3_PENNA|nr:hypothetical protein PENNAL_c0004G11504 [Penicillium nalgiovense]